MVGADPTMVQLQGISGKEGPTETTWNWWTVQSQNIGRSSVKNNTTKKL
jgi:hypothetical protein